MNFRNELKRQLGHKLFEIESHSDDEEFERADLGLRLLQFLKYEQDPEFEQLFNEFLSNRKWEFIKNNNKTQDNNEQDR